MDRADVRIGIKAEYDDSAARAAQQDMQRMQRFASPEQGGADAAMAQGMKLDTLDRKALLAELRELNAARRSAASAGDAVAWQKLTTQYKQAKEALEQLNTQSNLNKMALLGQAQAGMQFAGGLGQLGKQLQSGSTDLAGMATQALGLGMAMKTAMGPIGWVMIAVQGLQMAWDAWQGRKSDDINRQIEETRARTEALVHSLEQQRESSRVEQNAKLEGASGLFERRMKEADARTEVARRQQERVFAAQGEEERHRLALLDQEAAAERVRVQAAREAGELDELSAARQMAALEERLEVERRAVSEASGQRQAVAAREAAANARAQAKEYARAAQEASGRFEPVLRVKLPSEAEMAEVERKLAELDEESPQFREVEKRKDDIVNMMHACREALEAAGLAASAGARENMEYVRRVQETVAAQRETARRRGEEADAAAEAAEAAARQVQNRREELAAQAATAAQTRQARLATAQKAAQEEARQREWVDRQRECLAAQVAWLEETVGHLELGSEAARRWGAQLQNVRLQRIREQLGELEEQYRITTDYARQEHRTAAQIHAADRRALQERERALRQLRQTPGMDAATLRQIDGQLRETRRQSAALNRSMRQASLESQRALTGLRPLGQTARNRGMQGTLRRAERAYVRLAQNAERQVRMGDARALRRTLGAMRRNARQQERLAGHTGKAAEQYRETLSLLKALRQGLRREERGLSARQRQQLAVERELGQRGKAERRLRQAAEREARAAGRRGRRAAGGKDARSGAVGGGASGGAVGGSSGGGAAGAAALAGLGRLTESHAQERAALSQLAAAVRELSSMASSVASAAEGAAGATARATTSLSRQIERINRQIERINNRI